jgi:hypothetical protein
MTKSERATATQARDSLSAARSALVEAFGAYYAADATTRDAARAAYSAFAARRHAYREDITNQGDKHMTLHEMSAKLMAQGARRTVDWAGEYDISKDEATRIATRSGSADDFERIWSDETWWRDAE